MTRNDIYERWPAFFALAKEGVRRSPICFGLEVGDGWLLLLWDLFEQIEKVLEEHGNPEFRLTQVKEKFGTLRVYWEGGPVHMDLVGPGERAHIKTKPEGSPTWDDIVEDLIETACAKSAETCEECGAPGKLRGIGGWYLTTCEDHLIPRHQRVAAVTRAIEEVWEERCGLQNVREVGLFMLWEIWLTTERLAEFGGKTISEAAFSLDFTVEEAREIAKRCGPTGPDDPELIEEMKDLKIERPTH